VSGTEERPRLCVFRSNKHIYAQVVDDVAQRTLAHASTLQAAVVDINGKFGDTKDAGMAVGKEIAKQCAEKGVTKVCFDRSGYTYHGRIQVRTTPFSHDNRLMAGLAWLCALQLMNLCVKYLQAVAEGAREGGLIF
jgi:large subunit ribosomal protein L18